MSDPHAPEVSFVVPAFREASRLPGTLEELERFAGGSAFPLEVVIVVERSPDATLEIARRHAERCAIFSVLDSGPQRGKGHAVRTGMLRARGACVIYMDADLSVPLAEVAAFVRHFHEHPDAAVLIGDRQHRHSRITRRQSPLREHMGQVFNRMIRSLAGVPWQDTQCGFKAFRLAAAREIFRRQKLDGFAFDVEVLLLAGRLDYRVETLPVEWINFQDSKVRIVRDSLRMARDAFRVQRIVEETLSREARAQPVG